VTLHKFPKKEILFPGKSESYVTRNSKKGNSCADRLILAGIISGAKLNHYLIKKSSGKAKIFCQFKRK